MRETVTAAILLYCTVRIAMEMRPPRPIEDDGIVWNTAIEARMQKESDRNYHRTRQTQVANVPFEDTRPQA